MEILGLSDLNSNFYGLLSVPNLLYIYSYVNSLFKLKNEENIILAYYHIYQKTFLKKGYKIVLLKGSFNINSGLFSYSVSKILSTEISYFSYSLSCFETTNYINCFYINNNGLLTISIFDKNLDL